MAKKKSKKNAPAKSNTKQIFAVILILGGGYIFYRNIQKKRENEIRFQNIPSRPTTSNTSAWKMWAQRIIDLYGQAKELWEPGGPFHKDNTNGLPAPIIATLPTPIIIP